MSMLVRPVVPENWRRVSSVAVVRGSSIALTPVPGGIACRTVALGGAKRRKLEASTEASSIAPAAGRSQRARQVRAGSMTTSRSSIMRPAPRRMVWRGTIGASVRGSELAWLLGFSDPVLGVGWNPRASRASRWRLGRMRALLRLAGGPDRSVRVVLVAGTKGKGSTAAFLASILHADGLRAGLFTSPHLQPYRERVRVAVQRETVARAIARVCRAEGANRRVVKPIGGRASLALAGDHQRQNAALAIAAAEALGAGSAIGPGLRDAVWPARYEVLRRRPTIVLDGAHNDASAEALARTLRLDRRGRRLVLVIGINQDKDARAVLAPLVSLASAIVATRSASPRAADPTDVALAAARMGGRPAFAVAGVSAAIAAARADAGPDGLVCVTGSLALAGEARTALGLHPLERWW